MFGNGSFKQDPLDLARSQMDFARMSADAPGVKEILFKAQTIIPVTPAKPLWQKGAPVAGAALTAGLLFVPLLPMSSSLELMTVNFEGSMQRSEAQAIEFGIRRALSADILMGSEFNAAGAGESSHLTLSFSSAGEPQLAASVEQAVNQNAADREPLFGRVITEASVNERESIVTRASRMFAAEQPDVQYLDRSNRTASELLKHLELLQQGLNKALESEGYRILNAQFLTEQPVYVAEGEQGQPDTGPVSHDSRILNLPCWPATLTVTVDAGELAEYERNTLYESCMNWIESVNLAERSAGLAQRPGELLPIIVEVRNPDGVVDRLLTERLQALIVQPVGGEITDVSSWDVRKAVEGPLHELLGSRMSAVAYERVSDPAYNRDVNFFYVHVSLLNQFDTQEEISERVLELEQTIDSSSVNF